MSVKFVDPSDSLFDFKGYFLTLDSLIELPSLYCGAGVTYVPVMLDDSARVVALGSVRYVGDPELINTIKTTLIHSDMKPYVLAPMRGYWLLLVPVDISRKPDRIYIAP
jgi:hypothetical protein